MRRPSFYLLAALASLWASSACRPAATQAPQGPEPVASAPAGPEPAAPEPPGAAPLASAGAVWSPLEGSASPTDEQMLAIWQRFVVQNQKPAQRVLFTWTTPEQAAALRRGGPLLAKSASDGHEMSLYFEALWTRYPRQRWARQLMNPPFHRVRYAWPHPWATRLGGDSKPYGDALVRVQLKPGAITLVFFPGESPEKSRFEAHDADNRKLTDAEIARQAASIAAVLHVNEESGFREYVLCNEAMIDEWSTGSAEARAKLDGEISALDSLARHAQKRPGWLLPPDPSGMQSWSIAVQASWDSPPGPTLEAHFASSLAFPNARHAPTEATAAALLSSLRELPPQGDPFSRRPSLAAPKILPPPPKPPTLIRRMPGCTPDSTFSCIERNDRPCRGPDDRIAPCTWAGVPPEQRHDH